MKNTIKTFLACMLMGTLAFAVGCGESGPPTFPVSGTVTGTDGNPVEGAAVSFVAQGGGISDAVGITDASGKYTLKTKSKSGAEAGDYKITIAKYESAEGDVDTGEPPSLEESLDLDNEYPDDFNEEKESSKADDGSGNELPAKYANENSSGLTAKVTADGANTFDFTLE